MATTKTKTETMAKTKAFGVDTSSVPAERPLNNKNSYVELIADALREGVAYTVEGDGRSLETGTWVFFDHGKVSSSVPKRTYETASRFARDPLDFVVWHPIRKGGCCCWESPWGPGMVTVNLGRSLYSPLSNSAHISA
jgi:cysteinyl-tRNA synthetase